jgi:hypothetical protein
MRTGEFERAKTRRFRDLTSPVFQAFAWSLADRRSLMSAGVLRRRPRVVGSSSIVIGKAFTRKCPLFLSPMKRSADANLLFHVFACSTNRGEVDTEDVEPEVRIYLSSGQPAPLRTTGNLVSLENVSFRYPKARNPLLEGVTFNLDQGGRCALVGAVGTSLLSFVRHVLLTHFGLSFLLLERTRQIDPREPYHFLLHSYFWHTHSSSSPQDRPLLSTLC